MCIFLSENASDMGLILLKNREITHIQILLISSEDS